MEGRQFPFGVARISGSLGGFGAWRLVEYSEVKKLQSTYNRDRTTSRSENEVDPSQPRITTGAITVDGKWGPNTMSAVKAWVDWKVRKAACTNTSGSEAYTNGPYAFVACLTNAGFSAGEIDVLQKAWTEFRDEERRQASLLRSAKDQCESAGGTWDSSNSRCIQDGGGGGGGGDTGGPGVSDEGGGMSTGAKLGLVALAAAAVIGIYYVATD